MFAVLTDLAARLTDTLLPVAATHLHETTKPTDSVAVELALWRALDQALHTLPPADPVAHVADAAYQALLPFQPRGSFLDLELEVYRQLRA